MKSQFDIVASVEDLIPIPHTAIRLAQIIGDEKSTINEVVKVVRYDQALSVDILKIANSSMSAPNRHIGNIRDAIVRLGSGCVLQIVFSKCVKSVMKRPLEQYGYCEDDLWHHSIASAIAAENLVKYVNVKIETISFTAALLHDIGKLLMIQVLPEEKIKEIMHLITKDHISWAAAEKKLFSFTHADIGAEIAKTWKLPEQIERAIRYHNRLNTVTDPITDCVRVSNIVARAIGKGIGNEGMSVVVDSDVADRLGLSQDNFELLCAITAQKFEDVLAMYENR